MFVQPKLEGFTREVMMKDLKDLYPGTVIGCISKSDPEFGRKLRDMIASIPTDTSLCDIIKSKILSYGPEVICKTETTQITGIIIDVLPYGCEWMDPKWIDATIVVKDDKDGTISNWNPKHVRFGNYL